MNSASSPPAPDEFEVSLFGSGYGESIVAHLGYDEWIVVDSCCDRESREPVALTYLANLGVDVGTSVKLVVASHWHDDHIDGVARIFEAARAAHLVCSGALRSSEFTRLAAASGRSMMRSPGASEFHKIFGILRQRRERRVRLISVAPMLAHANKCLFRRNMAEGPYAAEVHSLTPSDAAVIISLQEIAQLLPKLRDGKRRAVAQTPNQVAVVLWVVVGTVRVLLGADLEESSNPALGWQAVIGSPVRPTGQAAVFKVPHHGSANAHSDAVWDELLTHDPIALIAPFASGRKPLPAPTDVARIADRASQGYVTAQPQGWKPPQRSGAVEKMARITARQRRVIRGPMGHIRVRGPLGGGWFAVDLFNGAFRLADLKSGAAASAATPDSA